MLETRHTLVVRLLQSRWKNQEERTTLVREHKVTSDEIVEDAASIPKDSNMQKAILMLKNTRPLGDRYLGRRPWSQPDQWTKLGQPVLGTDPHGPLFRPKQISKGNTPYTEGDNQESRTTTALSSAHQVGQGREHTSGRARPCSQSTRRTHPCTRTPKRQKTSKRNPTIAKLP